MVSRVTGPDGRSGAAHGRQKVPMAPRPATRSTASHTPHPVDVFFGAGATASYPDEACAAPPAGIDADDIPADDPDCRGPGCAAKVFDILALLDSRLTRLRSREISFTDWYRSSGSFWRHSYTILSSSGSSAEFTADIGSGSTLTISYISAVSWTPLNGRLAGEELVQQRAERKDVGAVVGVEPLDLLG